MQLSIGLTLAPLARNRIATAVLVALSLGWLTGCGGGGGGGGGGSGGASNNSAGYGDTPNNCSTADQRSWLQSYMSDRYFWNANMGTANANALDMGAYFRSILYATVDRYSYTESTAQFEQFYGEGVFMGYGYSVTWSDAAKTVLKVRQVEPRSPVGLAGLKRGDTVISIDGYTPAQIVAGTPGRATAAGQPRTLVVRDALGVTRTISVSSAEFPYVSVPATAVFTQNNGASSVKVGYFVYQQFINASAPELAAAFKTFAKEGVKELIVDLRYNGGGSISIARDLASMIGGDDLDGRVFVQLRYNAKHPEDNTVYMFASSASGLPATPLTGLNRVVFITAEGTASASELVINGLIPHKNVIQIGATTYGKPYGFLPVDACGLTYNAVNFETVNALGMGRYDNGLTPTCEVADDLDHQLGDPAEARLAGALQYIKTGSCPAPTARASILRGVSPAAARTPGPAYGEVSLARMRAD